MLRPAESMQTTHFLINRPFVAAAFAHLLEPIDTTILAVQPVRQWSQLIRLTPMAFIAIRAIAKDTVLVSNIAEPMNLLISRKEAQRNTVHGCVTPSFVEEIARLIEIVKVVPICLRAPKVQVADFEIAPEMTCAVAMGGLCVVGTQDGIREPVVRVLIRAEGVAGMFFEEGRCCRPEGGYGFRVIVDIYSEAIGFVILGHKLENVVLDIAEIPVEQQNG